MSSYAEGDCTLSSENNVRSQDEAELGIDTYPAIMRRVIRAVKTLQKGRIYWDISLP